MRSPRPAGIVATYAGLAVGAVLVLAPFLLTVSTALKSPRQFAERPVLSPPAPPTLENVTTLFGHRHDFVTPVAVTAQVVVVVVVGQLAFSILAAYAFAWLRFPGRDLLFWLYLVTMMVPPVVTVVPLYLMMAETGLRNTFWALVLPYLFGSPYAVFLLREYFRGVPAELLDAARLDGAGTLRTVLEVVVPANRPIIATLAAITAVTHWNNFLWPLVITSGPTWQVVTVATAALQTRETGNWTLVMAATTIAIVPMAALFVLAQRGFVRSLTVDPTGRRPA